MCRHTQIPTQRHTHVVEYINRSYKHTHLQLHTYTETETDALRTTHVCKHRERERERERERVKHTIIKNAQKLDIKFITKIYCTQQYHIHVYS